MLSDPPFIPACGRSQRLVVLRELPRVCHPEPADELLMDLFLHAFREIEPSGSLWGHLPLLPTARHRVDLHRLNVDTNRAYGLDPVHDEPHPAQPADLANRRKVRPVPAEVLNGAEGDDPRVGPEGALDHLDRDATPARHQQIDLHTAGAEMIIRMDVCRKLEVVQQYPVSGAPGNTARVDIQAVGSIPDIGNAIRRFRVDHPGHDATTFLQNGGVLVPGLDDP